MFLSENGTSLVVLSDTFLATLRLAARLSKSWLHNEDEHRKGKRSLHKVAAAMSLKPNTDLKQKFFLNQTVDDIIDHLAHTTNRGERRKEIIELLSDKNGTDLFLMSRYTLQWLQRKKTTILPRTKCKIYCGRRSAIACILFVH